MSESTERSGIRGWWRSMAAAFGRALGIKPSPAKPRKSSSRSPMAGIDMRARAAVSRQLAAEGFDRTEIARRTGLSHDIISMLLSLETDEPAESSADGSFFRILNTRMAT